MNADTLLTLFRNEVDDTADPYFLSDDAYYIYLTDAINQYCRYGRGIRDHTSDLTLVDYVANDPWLLIDDKIIKIIAAYDTGNSNKKLTVIDFDSYNKGDTDLVTTDYGVTSIFSTYPDQTGVLHALIMGMEEGKARLVNIPVVDGTISFVIERYPEEDISASNETIVGVPIHDRLILNEWVKYRYYSHQDAETFDPDKAETARLTFLSQMREVDSDDMVKTKKQGFTRYGGI